MDSGLRRQAPRKPGRPDPAFRLSRGGQSLVEYTALVVIVAAALLGMSLYLKRGLSGRLRSAADSAGQQYDPRATTATFTVSVRSKTVTKSKLITDQVVDAKGTVANVMEFTTDVVEDTTNKVGTEHVCATGTSIWY